MGSTSEIFTSIPFTLLELRSSDRCRTNSASLTNSVSPTSTRRTRSCGKRADASMPTVSKSPNSQKRSEEHTSELQSLMRISYAVLCLKKKKKLHQDKTNNKRTHSYQC